MPREAKSNLREDSLLEEEAQIEESDSEDELALSNVEEIIESLESPLESPASSRPVSVQSSYSPKRPRYLQIPKYGRSKGKDGRKDELVVLTSKTTMKKYCSAEVNQTPDRTLNSLSDFDIAGMKYARDLTSLDPIQRNFVEKLVADAIFYAKQGKLTKHSSFQLGMHSSYYSDTSSPQQYQFPTTLPPVSTFANMDTRNENMNVMFEFLQFNPNH